MWPTRVFTRVLPPPKWDSPPPSLEGTVSHTLTEKSSLPENKKFPSSARHVTASAWPEWTPSGS